MYFIILLVLRTKKNVSVSICKSMIFLAFLRDIFILQTAHMQIDYNLEDSVKKWGNLLYIKIFENFSELSFKEIKFFQAYFYFHGT